MTLTTSLSDLIYHACTNTSP